MPLKFNYIPESIHEDDWVFIKSTKVKGVVIKLLNQGERLLIRVPSDDDWPFPKHVYAFTDSVRKSVAPRQEKEPSPEYEEGLF